MRLLRVDQLEQRFLALKPAVGADVDAVGIVMDQHHRPSTQGEMPGHQRAQSPDQARPKDLR